MAKRIKKSVTITTIAETLNVSPSTVSFVLSGKAKERAIGDETADRVRNMAEKMKYVPNYWARSLRRKRSHVISVLLDHMTNNWAETVLRAVTNVVHEKDYMPFFTTTWGDVKLLQRALLEILQRQDEGVISSSSIISESDYLRFQELRIPVVFLGAIPRTFYTMQNIHAVRWDEAEAVKNLIRHLYASGRRRIAFAGMRSGLGLEDTRFNAFIETLEELDLQVDHRRFFWGEEEIPKFAEFFKPLFDNKHSRPDAIFAMTDGIALQVWRDLDKIGIRVPDDVALAGMGGWMKLVLDRVGLTTAIEPLQEMGMQAAKRLLELIENPDAYVNGSVNLIKSNEISAGKTV